MSTPTPDERRAREQLLATLGEHRHRRTPATGLARRMAVESMLRDPAWARWSDDRIARHVGVDSRTVATVRRTLEVRGEIEFRTNLITADGRLLSRGRDPAARKARRGRRIHQIGAQA